MDERFEPGIVKIDTCQIISAKKGTIDVTQLVANIMIYEDIMSPFITGKVTILDATALGEALPLLGEEMLYLEISTPGQPGPEFQRNGMFSLYKMETRENVKTKMAAYVLCFASIEAITDVNQKISQTYKGKISDTVTQIINSRPGLGTFKTAVVEPTSNNEIHTSNFWTPTQNIYYLTSKALNSINNPSYVFFENNEGFVFASIDSLFLAPITYSFIKDSKMRGPEGGQDVEEEYRKVLDMSVPIMYDYFEQVQQGFYGSNVYHYDMITKRLNFKNLVSFDQLKKVKLNPEPASSDNLQFLPEASMVLSVIHRDLYSGSPVLPIDHHNRRMALLKQMSSITINIKVYGKMNYSVGNVVNFTAYKDDVTDEKTTADQDVDMMLSGNYLITAISHDISRENHYCNIELSKDSITKQVN